MPLMRGRWNRYGTKQTEHIAWRNFSNGHHCKKLDISPDARTVNTRNTRAPQAPEEIAEAPLAPRKNIFLIFFSCFFLPFYTPIRAFLP